MNPTMPMTAREWAAVLKPYQQSSDARAFFELAVTLFAYVGLMALMLFVLHAGYWTALLLIIPSTGFLLRLFVIQHDCGHQSLFSNAILNDWIGRALGILTLTPYDYWRHSHAMHHASCGNLDHRGIGDIDTLTIEEYLARSPAKQKLYRLYRNPITLFVIGPAYMFFLQHRLPIGMMKRGWMPWLSTMGTNLGIFALWAALAWLTDIQSVLLFMLPTLEAARCCPSWKLSL